MIFVKKRRQALREAIKLFMLMLEIICETIFCEIFERTDIRDWNIF